MTRIVTKSKLYNRLTNEPAFDVRTDHATKAGVKIISRGAKKGTSVEVILPSTDLKGQGRVVRVTLSGRQARAIFETLNQHYSKTNND